MAVTSEGHTGAPLGVGSIVSESFSILFRKFVAVIMLGFVPTLLALVVSGVLNGWELTLGTGEPQFDQVPNVAAIIVSVLIQVVIYGVTTALLVQLAYDAKLGRPIQVGRYIGPALAAAVPIAVLSIASGLLMTIGLVALIIPGIWVYAVFSMMAPAVVIERAGFGGLGRSAELTKGYRWPIVGAVIIIWVCTWLLSFAIAFVTSMVSNLLGGSLVATLVIYALLNAIGYGLGGISIALIYARLREIKEGVRVDQIAAVFD